MAEIRSMFDEPDPRTKIVQSRIEKTMFVGLLQAHRLALLYALSLLFLAPVAIAVIILDSEEGRIHWFQLGITAITVAVNVVYAVTLIRVRKRLTKKVGDETALMTDPED